VPSHHTDRISEDILRELTAILRTVKDPRVSEQLAGGRLSVVRAEVARDLGSAKIYISSIDGLDAAKEAVKGLVSAAGYVRRQLGQALALRHTPELRFIADNSIAHSAEIAEKLNKLQIADGKVQMDDEPL